MDSPFSRLDYKSLSNTEEGSAFLEKYLHPPGNAIGPLRGIPDRNCVPSALVELRDDLTISPPSGTGNWDLAILVLPLPDTPYIVCRRNSDGSSLMLHEYNLPILSDLPSTEPTVLTSYCANFRTLGKSLTCRLDAPALSNQGRLYAAQFDIEKDEVVRRADSNRVFPGMTAPSGYSMGTVQYYHYRVRGTDGIPFSGTTLAQLSCSSVAHEAKEGCFMTMRYSEPTINYTPTAMERDWSVVHNTDPAQNVAMYPVNIFDIDASGTFFCGNRQPGLRQMGVVSSAPIQPTTSVIASYMKPALPPDHTTAGWIVFNGISREATVTVRLVEILETLVQASSPWQPFLTPSAIPDSHAMDSAYLVRQTMLDGYPAAFNDFGSFFSGVKKLAPKLLDLATSKTGRTALGLLPGGSVLNTVLGAVKDLGAEGISMPVQLGSEVSLPRKKNKRKKVPVQQVRPVPAPRNKKKQ